MVEHMRNGTYRIRLLDATVSNVPTRELAEDIAHALRMVAAHINRAGAWAEMEDDD